MLVTTESHPSSSSLTTCFSTCPSSCWACSSLFSWFIRPNDTTAWEDRPLRWRAIEVDLHLFNVTRGLNICFYNLIHDTERYCLMGDVVFFNADLVCFWVCISDSCINRYFYTSLKFVACLQYCRHLWHVKCREQSVSSFNSSFKPEQSCVRPEMRSSGCSST